MKTKYLTIDGYIFECRPIHSSETSGKYCMFLGNQWYECNRITSEINKPLAENKNHFLPLEFEYNGKIAVKWYDGLWHVMDSGSDVIKGRTIKILTQKDVSNHLKPITSC